MRWESIWLFALGALLVTTVVTARVQVSKEPKVVIAGLSAKPMKTPVAAEVIQSGPASGGGPGFQLSPQRVALEATIDAAAEVATPEGEPVAPPPPKIIEAPRATAVVYSGSARSVRRTRAPARQPVQTPSEPAYEEALPPTSVAPDVVAVFGDTTSTLARAHQPSLSLQNTYVPLIDQGVETRPQMAIPMGDRTALTLGSASTLVPSGRIIETRSQWLNDPGLTNRVGREVSEPVFSGAAVGLRFKLN